jgi:polysaccharide export outer membrane protein
MRVFVPVILALGLAGCSSLSHDGPSARQIETGSVPSGPYALIDLNYRVTQLVAANPPRVLRLLSGVSSAAPLDLIGEGDVLAVTIYQPGSGPSARAQDDASKDDVQSLPRLTVDRSGSVSVPFAGSVGVSGLTPQQASLAIQDRLRGRLINPQVVVAMVTNVANAVTVIGEVRSAGRFPLSVSNDRLLDVIAAAGGATKPAADCVVTVARGDLSVGTSLSALLADPAENVRLAPRDQIRVSYSPRKFSTFGALAKASQIPIEDEHLSLAGALSRMGGLDPASANAASVLVFRMERPEVAAAIGGVVADNAKGIPVIYRLNLRDPSGLFVANSFEVRNDDLIYVPRSDAAEVHKFFDLVSTISRVGYDISVTSVLR